KEQIKTAESWLRSFGLNVTTEQIFLTAGAQNALSVILIALFHAGDKIAVDHFTYTNFKWLANFLHIQLISIDRPRRNDAGSTHAGLQKHRDQRCLPYANL